MSPLRIHSNLEQCPSRRWETHEQVTHSCLCVCSRRARTAKTAAPQRPYGVPLVLWRGRVPKRRLRWIFGCSKPWRAPAGRHLAYFNYSFNMAERARTNCTRGPDCNTFTPHTSHARTTIIISQRQRNGTGWLISYPLAVHACTCIECGLAPFAHVTHIALAGLQNT